MNLKCNLIALLAIGLISCVSANGSNEIPADNKSSVKLKCEASYTLMCLKLDILNLVDKLSTTSTEFKLMNGITLVRDPNRNKTQNLKIVQDLARAFPDNPEKRLNGFLVAKLQDVINSYSLKFKLISNDAVEAFQARKDGGFGGGGGGKKGGYGAMIGMAMMMKGAMMAMGLGAVAALAGKALLTGMMALTLAAIAALKGMGGKEEKKTTYEIISKPIYSHSHSHSHGAQHAHAGSQEDSGHGGYGYARSLNANSPTLGDIMFKLPESIKA